MLCGIGEEIMDINAIFIILRWIFAIW